MKIVYLGGQKAGFIGLLSVIASGECEVTGVVAYDSIVKQLAWMLNIPTFDSVKEAAVARQLREAEKLICVHGKEIVPQELLDLPRCGGINVHPCLYAYKGANPVGRLLKDKNTLASVGIHKMTDKLDEGSVQAEEFVDVTGCRTVEEVYNELYPYYTIALFKILRY